MKTTDEPIIVEETFNSPVESVWNALTSHDEMLKWYFDNIPTFIPVAGFQTQFDVRSDERIFRHNWKVTEAVPLKLIKYTWEFDNYPGKSVTAFELIQEGDSTKLRLTMDVLEDFPDDVIEFRRESCIGGWDYFLSSRLKEYLQKN